MSPDAATLARLFDLEASLERQLLGTRNAIKGVGERYSKDNGYRIHLSYEQLKREVLSTQAKERDSESD